jgi:hypothetical protein
MATAGGSCSRLVQLRFNNLLRGPVSVFINPVQDFVDTFFADPSHVWLTPASCGYPPFLFRVKAHRRGGRELGPPRAERKTMIMRESTGDDVGISPKLD